MRAAKDQQERIRGAPGTRERQRTTWISGRSADKIDGLGRDGLGWRAWGRALAVNVILWPPCSPCPTAGAPAPERHRTGRLTLAKLPRLATPPPAADGGRHPLLRSPFPSIHSLCTCTYATANSGSSLHLPRPLPLCTPHSRSIPYESLLPPKGTVHHPRGPLPHARERSPSPPKGLSRDRGGPIGPIGPPQAVVASLFFFTRRQQRR